MYCDVIHLVVVKKEKRDETKDIVRVIDGFGKLLSVSGSAFLNWHSRIKSSRIEFINVKPNAESGCFSFYQLYATEYKITTKLSSFNTQCRQFNYTCTTKIRRWFTLQRMYHDDLCGAREQPQISSILFESNVQL